jgi:hypothetical protein
MQFGRCPRNMRMARYGFKITQMSKFHMRSIADRLFSLCYNDTTNTQ